MPNKPAIPFAKGQVRPQRDSLHRALPTHELAARRHRRTVQAPHPAADPGKPERPAGTQGQS